MLTISRLVALRSETRSVCHPAISCRRIVIHYWPLVASRLEFIEPGQLSMFKNIRGDFLAHGGRWGAQGFWAMVVYRFGRWRYGVRPQVLRKCLSLVYWVLYKIVQVVTGIELPCEVEVGHNFTIDHFGGIIITGYAKFGDNCRIRDGVVVGLRVSKRNVPRSMSTLDRVRSCMDNSRR
jgi:hypothetical protein